MYSTPVRASVLALLVFILSCQVGCDSNDKDNETVSSNSSERSIPAFTPPSSADFGALQVHFPPNYSHTSEAQVQLRGTVLEPGSVASLSVDGLDVEYDDNGDWTTQLSLEPGVNTIAVVANFADGTTTTIDYELHRDYFLSRASDLIWLPSSEQFYALDAEHDAILILQPQTANPSKFSPAAGASGDNLINNPIAMSLDPDRNRIIVAQLSDNAFVAVDMTSGAQEILEPEAMADFELLETPASILRVGTDLYVADVERVYFDDEGERIAEATDDSLAALYPLVYRMNLETLQRTPVIYNPTLGSTKIGTVTAMAYDEAADLIYLADLVASNVSDLGTYSPTTDKFEKILARQYTENDDGETVQTIFRFPEIDDLMINAEGDALYCLGANQINSVSLDDRRELLQITANGRPKNQTLPLADARNLVLAGAEPALLYLDNALDALIEVAPQSGQRSLYARDDSALPFASVSDLAFSQDFNALFISDVSLGRLFQWNLNPAASGEKSTVIARYQQEYKNDTFTELNDENPILSPRQITTTSDGQVIIFDGSFVSAVQTDGETPSASRIRSYVATVTDASYDYRDHMVYLSGSDIAGSFIATLPLGGSEPEIKKISFNSSAQPDRPLGAVRGIALDSTQERLLATDSSQNRILAVDLEDGARSYFSDFIASPTDEDIQLQIPQSIALDRDNDRAFILDMSQSAIIEVNLNDGTRSIWLDIEPNFELGISNLKALTLNPYYQYLLAYDEQSHFVLAIDIASKSIVRLMR